MKITSTSFRLAPASWMFRRTLGDVSTRMCRPIRKLLQ
jgi:hypothetical protein